MLDLENKLYVFHDDNSVFADYSNEAQSYSRDEFGLEMVAAEDYLYVGFEKPINTIYVEMNTANTTANTFTFQYYNGTTWTAVPKFNDDTKGFTRSGFITWERNLDSEAEVEINSTTAYFYRLKPSADHSVGTEVMGVNIVFSDDNDLATVVPNINSNTYYATNQSSHVMAHVAARDWIVQNLRNDGRLKQDFSTGRILDINPFDILKVKQINQASKYKALELIFNDLSDVDGDSYSVKANEFASAYNFAYGKIQFLDLDTDNDGLSDRHEEMRSATVTLVRR